MSKAIKYFITIKWIFSSLLIFISSSAYSYEDLKRVEIKNYIIDYEEYNDLIINPKKDKKATIDPSQHAHKTISKISDILNKEMKIKKERSDKLASHIAYSAKKYDIDPRIMITIMKIESQFKQNAVNLQSCSRTKEKNCGDYSIAQINLETWSKQFPKMGRKPLDIQRLKTDEKYAIFRMAEILSIIKSQHAKTDPLWFARYHSSTPKFKNRYLAAIRKEYDKVKKLGPNLMKDFPKDPNFISSNP